MMMMMSSHIADFFGNLVSGSMGYLWDVYESLMNLSSY